MGYMTGLLGELQSALASGANSTTRNELPPTLDELKAMLETAEEPIATWMRSHGFEPTKGDVLLLPSSFDDGQMMLPNYAAFSSVLSDKAIVIKGPGYMRKPPVAPEFQPLLNKGFIHVPES